jgi:hypothetical protein
MAEGGNVYRILMGRPLGKLGDGWITLRWILRGQVTRMGVEWKWLRIVSNGGLW